MSGVKHDQGKPDLTYLSYDLLSGMARVRAFGATKYSKDNWKYGFKITRSLAAALRHIYQFLQEDSVDEESGECHLLHAMCCLEHAYNDYLHHPDNDDRVFTKSFIKGEKHGKSKTTSNVRSGGGKRRRRGAS